jgi:hypothetical protein
MNFVVPQIKNYEQQIFPFADNKSSGNMLQMLCCLFSLRAGEIPVSSNGLFRPLPNWTAPSFSFLFLNSSIQIPQHQEPFYPPIQLAYCPCRLRSGFI